jgi:hypothetical protein
MAPRRRLAAWAALTAAGTLLPFWAVLAGSRTLVQRDTHRLYAPIRALVVEALRGGRLPLWNPYEGAGKPLFAEGIHQVLHPVSLLGAALAPQSVDFLVLAYLVAAALGAFALARSLGASEPASAGAGLGFALSGFTVSMVGNLVFLAGLASLPWLVAAARWAGAGARWGVPATALATACAFLSGDVQVTLIGLALGTLLAADAGGRRGAARAAGGMAAGLLLAGVQVAATAGLLPETSRSLGLDAEEPTRWALSPLRLLEWVLPGLFRGPLTEVPGRAFGAVLPFEFSESVYLGAPLVVAAVLGALRARAGRRTALVLAVAAGVLLWLALGHQLGAQQLGEVLPVWSRFGYAEKMAGPLALCLASLAALGIDAFAAGRLPAAARWALAGAAIAVAMAGAALVLVPALAALAIELGPAAAFRLANAVAGLPHLLIGLVAVLALDRLRAPAARAAALAAAVALAPALAVRAAAALGSREARTAEGMPLAGDGPVPRIYPAAEGLYTSEVNGAYVDATARRQLALLSPALNVASRVDSLKSYGAFEPRRLRSLEDAFGPGIVRAHRRFALSHVVVPYPVEEVRRDALLLGTAGGTLVERNGGLNRVVWAVPHRPWAFFPGRALAVARPEEAHDAVLSLVASADDARVVVEAPAPPPTSPGRILRAERSAESVRIEAESEGPALLVVQDAFWPGWRAFVDGQETEILATDVLVRGVPWPGGRHALVMRYEPPEVRVGLVLSGVGAVVLVLLVVGAARGRRPRAAPGEAVGAR